MLYFRSDRRPPLTIFSEEFQPRNKKVLECPNQAIAEGLAPLNSYNLVPIPEQDSPSTTNYNNAVCISKKFESAAMFPLDDLKPSYIYIISLPKSVNISMHTPVSSFPPLLPNQVINLHNLQMEQARHIINYFKSIHVDIDPKKAGWCLHAYEMFTPKINAENIIAAVKINRKNLPIAQDEYVLTIDSRLMPTFAVKFKPTNVIFNRSYQMKKPTDFQDAKNLLSQFDPIKSSWRRTPSFSYGLGGTLLGNRSEKINFIIEQELHNKYSERLN